MDVEPKFLETILEKHSRETSVEKIMEMNTSPVVSKGDNYASDIMRVAMKTILGSGRTEERSVIVKTVPSTEFRAKQLTEWGIFRKEIKMYNETLPLIEEVLNQTGEYTDPLWGRCLYTRCYDMLVLEDLKNYGFTMENRFKGLDYEHAKLAVKELAKFHAASVVLKDKGMIDQAEFYYPILRDSKKDQDMMNQFLDQSFQKIAEVIETTWEEKWHSYAKAIRGMLGTLYSTWKACMVIDEDGFNVLNHGDYWVNNMMFKHVPDSRDPCAMRLIDFQMCHYNSPAFDWHYFTNSSLQPEVRKLQYHDLLEHYHSSLVRNLKLHKIDESRIPSFEKLEEDINKRSIYGFFMACFLMPLMKTNPEDVWDIEDILKKIDNKEEIDVSHKNLMGKDFTLCMRVLLPEYRKLGIV